MYRPYERPKVGNKKRLSRFFQYILSLLFLVGRTSHAAFFYFWEKD